ncbi:MAG: VacJ family lipoprotein [Litoreibacter sp.]
MLQNIKRPYLKFLPMLIATASLAACSPAPTPVGIQDTLEKPNRGVHAFNKGADKIVVRPASRAYGTVLPSPVRKGVSNFASNLSLPGMVINNLLQARIEDAGTNAFRFATNTVFGLGGLIDVATEAGIPLERTDFGETLYVWGAPEGTYVELPIIGPSTSRHTAGRIVDFFISPLNLIDTSPAAEVAVGSIVSARIGDRYTFSDLIDETLYESADSYTKAQLLYLQNRRFSLTGEAQVEDFDPYEDADDLQ